MRSFISRVRIWLNHIPVRNPIDRQMAIPLQGMLMGFIVLILIASGINSMIAKEIPWQVSLIRSATAITIVGIPLVLLRRGYFRASVLIIIAISFLLESFAVVATNLRDIAETLSLFTLAILMAGLLVSSRALATTFILSTSVVGFSAIQEWKTGLGEGGFVVAGNFILLNGLMSLFLHRFGVTLRTALTSAVERGNDLQKEIVGRKQANDELRAGEAHYGKLIDHARDVIFTVSTDGVITSLNPSFEIFTGWKREVWIGRTFDDLVAESDRKRANDQFNRILRGETLRSLRLRMHTRFEGTLIVEMNISPQFRDDQVVGLLGIARDMTQEQLAEDALKASEDQYRRLIEHSPYGVVVHIQGRIAYLNPTAMRLIGTESTEEVLDKPVLDFVHPAVIQRLKELGEGNEAVPLEERFVRLDGRAIDVEVTAYPFLYQDQSAVQVVFHDIMERKRGEEKLRASEEQFRVLFQNAPIGIGVADVQGNLLAFNEAMLSPGKYTPTDIEQLGNVSALYYDPQERNGAISLFQQQGYLHGYEVRFKGRDGTPYDALLSLTHTVFNGQPAIQAIVEDITRHKQAERAVQESESQLASIIESAMDAIITIDAEQKIIVFNKAAEKTFGYSAVELLRQPLDLLLPERYRVIHKTHIKHFDQSGAMGFMKPLSGLHRNGEEFPIETSISQIDVMGKKLFTVILRDVTERKRSEMEREELITELTTKNAELERFVYTVSHDLKSPLVTIRGFLGYLEQDALSGDLERLKGDAQRIVKAVGKMQDLLKDLLELSRIGRFANPSELISVEELAQEAIGLVTGRIQERGVKVELQPGLPSVYGDRVRLLEVLENLLDNAIKYMGDQLEPRIEIGYRGEEDGGHSFYVKDNGMGILPEYRERIFGLFNKLDASSEGTGVGLALVKRIIEFHRGRIWVEGTEGEGASFIFTLESVPSSN